MSRRSARLLAAGLLAVGLLPLAPAAQAAPAPPQDPPPLSEDGAMQKAKQDGRRTEVTSLTTDRRLVVADPTTGNFTETVAAGPVRARKGNAWVPLDPTLTRASGRLTPKAASVDVSIADGGSGPLAQLGVNGRSFSLQWPTALPTPTLQGDRAVYSDIRPGIDLVAATNASGFSEYLVVRTRDAASDPLLTQITMTVMVPDLTLARVGQRLEAVDSSGAEVFSTDPIRMWDSSSGRPSGTPVETSAYVTSAMPRGVTKDVDLSLSGNQIMLRPDQTFLANPDTIYPVVIDPSVSGTRERYATVDSSGRDGEYHENNHDEQPWVGLSPNSAVPYGGLVSRIFYGFQLPSNLYGSGVNVISAKFRHWQTKSMDSGADCAKTANGSIINVWEVHDFNDEFDWSHQPDVVQKMDGNDFAVGDVEQCHTQGHPGNAPAAQEWNVLAGVQHNIAAQDDILSFRINLAYDDNNDVSAANRAKGDRYYQNSLNYPALVIEYNSPPQAPTTSSASPSVVYQSESYVSSLNPILQTTVKDENTSQDVTATFFVTPYDPAGGTTGQKQYKSQAVRGPGTAGAPATTTAGQVTVVNGQRYSIYAKANDGIVDSAVGPTTTFTVDTSPPDLPTVSGGQSGTGTVALGTTLSFTIDAPEPDVVYYQYGLNTNNPFTKATPSALGGAVTVQVTVTQFGPNFFAARSYDRAGNTSTTVFKVNFKADGVLPSDRYRLDSDGTDLRTNTSAASTGKAVTIPAGTTFGPGRDAYRADGTTVLDCTDKALRVSPTTSVKSVVTSPPHPFDTSQAFTASAWLKPDALTGTATPSGDEAYAISMPTSSTTTAFSVGYRKDPSTAQVYWLFSVTDSSGRIRVEDTGNRSAALVTAGVWTHVSAVFDPVAQVANFYVNGSRVAQLTGLTIAPPKATQLQLGGGPLAGSTGPQWNGSIDEVLLYQGALPLAAVNSQRSERRSPATC